MKEKGRDEFYMLKAEKVYCYYINASLQLHQQRKYTRCLPLSIPLKLKLSRIMFLLKSLSIHLQVHLFISLFMSMSPKKLSHHEILKKKVVKGNQNTFRSISLPFDFETTIQCFITSPGSVSPRQLVVCISTPNMCPQTK